MSTVEYDLVCTYLICVSIFDPQVPDMPRRKQTKTILATYNGDLIGSVFMSLRTKKKFRVAFNGTRE